jgi:hypothetical protein
LPENRVGGSLAFELEAAQSTKVEAIATVAVEPP